MSSKSQIPPTPRVISPSPTPSESSSRDGYFPNPTRSKTARLSSVEPIEEQAGDSNEDSDLDRARARSRSPKLERKLTRQMNGGGGGVTTQAKTGMPSAAVSIPTRRKPAQDSIKPATGQDESSANGFLSPASAYPQGYGSSYWRNLSRSPSPLGLIPIHREWRQFIHKHEVPRKVLHVSIGFATLGLYYAGFQATQIHPVLLSLLIPVFTVDVIRFRWPAFNSFYIKCLGPLMRESEAHDRFNGVIMYLAGLWVTMRFCRKDVAVVSVLLLSWCDTAASTFGRMWGKYTPRVRRGKSLAGSLAAFVCGIGAAVLFWGLIAPSGYGSAMNEGANSFAFEGTLTMPARARELLGLSEKHASIDGPLALGVMGVISGLAASVSEAIDLWGLDDNLTIPILCGIELGAFLWGFGSN
ncbi:hypothetical protein LTR36_005736 [Oleoguttula mirabilis]|uniref:Phosphatidate cytidylyltransferase n=1 Tax=Oleoguttula mirabilis TaxID=1507867 RepID=A0AAV9JFB6_9PEZI|nr:hypothetical protein LTR36_005736 [Oleoguttula mirabilis]